MSNNDTGQELEAAEREKQVGIVCCADNHTSNPIITS